MKKSEYKKALLDKLKDSDILEVFEEVIHSDNSEDYAFMALVDLVDKFNDEIGIQGVELAGKWHDGRMLKIGWLDESVESKDTNS